ncbi:protein adenylyltransferase SelO family protein [Isoalcanivorax beigongshangi]|uniref:Protein adenylyltransferase SelO family protein n=1 Tax=Isoalcanivorax beigongshangi TaxID=3238810 RepID=A0ABV4AJP2_9GAMM
MTDLLPNPLPAADFDQLSRTLWQPHVPADWPGLQLLDADPRLRPESTAPLLNQLHPTGAAVLTDLLAHASQRCPQALATKYVGHQFGVLNPQLGDGRALLLTDLQRDGWRLEWWLKGGGATCFAQGDGRLSLHSAIREYVLSKALQALGIGCAGGTALLQCPDRRVRTHEPLGMLLRSGPSLMRIGHLEWLALRGAPDVLPGVLAYLNQRGPQPLGDDSPSLLAALVRRHAETVALWQAYGYVHGGLNSDNISVLGLTLDLGTGAFMQRYNPNWSPAKDDNLRRYAYHRQPEAVLEGLELLADALDQLSGQHHHRRTLDDFFSQLDLHYLRAMNRRFGLAQTLPGDLGWVRDWCALLQRYDVDYHDAFGGLAGDHPDAWQQALCQLFRVPQAPLQLTEWLQRYQQRLQQEHCSEAERQQRRRRANPCWRLDSATLQGCTDAVLDGDLEAVRRLRQQLLPEDAD